MNPKELIKEANAFYPEYLKAHSNQTNRTLHFIGASLFFVGIAIGFVTQWWYAIPMAILIGYVLPGIGHKYAQHNASFRATKPILCVLCATKMYWHSLTFKLKPILKNLH